MGTLPVMYGRIISIMQDPHRPPAQQIRMYRSRRTISAIIGGRDWITRGTAIVLLYCRFYTIHTRTSLKDI